MTAPHRSLPYPARQRIQADSEALRHPYQELSHVPHLLSVRFELDLRLLMQTSLSTITVTLPINRIEEAPYSVDDLQDTIYSRTGLPRSSFWLRRPPGAVHPIPGHDLEFPRPLGPPGSLPYRDPELTARTWIAPARLHDKRGRTPATQKNYRDMAYISHHSAHLLDGAGDIYPPDTPPAWLAPQRRPRQHPRPRLIPNN